MRRYLSVDCGGTKTAFLLCRETGELEAACTLGPGNYMVNGIDHVLSVLKDGILQICCQAAIAQSEITHSFIAIAGFKIYRRMCRCLPALYGKRFRGCRSLSGTIRKMHWQDLFSENRESM